MTRRRRTATAAVLLSFTLLLAACDGDDDPVDPTPTATAAASGTITVYSGRSEEFVASLFERFTETTGVEVEVRYGDSAELAAQILEEGEASPADVFFAQDAGSLGVIADAGLLSPLSAEVLDRVEPRFRSADGLWVGTSGRGRVAVYNTDVLADGDLPDSILSFTDPEWKGRLGLAPTNSSFQAHVAAIIETEGEQVAREWLEGLMANEPTFYEDNGSTVRGVAAAEVEVGLVNHYYKFEVEAEDGDLPIENHFFVPGDAGAFVNTAGVGILASAANAAGAAAFVDHVTGDAGQTWVAEETWEYPVAPGYEPSVDLLPISEFRGPEVDLSSLGASLPQALDLLAQVGMI